MREDLTRDEDKTKANHEDICQTFAIAIREWPMNSSDSEAMAMRFSNWNRDAVLVIPVRSDRDAVE